MKAQKRDERDVFFAESDAHEGITDVYFGKEYRAKVWISVDNISEGAWRYPT